MIRFDTVAGTQGWFQESGRDYDVVLSSRVRLSRNLAGHAFPHLLKSDEEQEIQSDILSAYASLGFETALIGDLPTLERRMLLERNYISRDYSLQTHKACVLSADRHMAATVNEIDHSRLAVFHGGRSFERCWEEADVVDSELEKSLDYAASLEWGYLNAEVLNSGTGMRSSVMLHVPGLVETGLIEKALKAVVQVGMVVKGFFGDDEGSLGQMYQISNQLTFGFGEHDLIEKLDAITQQLVHYERKARDELMEQTRSDVEDRVLRALGILRFCRKLPAREAVEHLSSIRLGAALGIVQAPLERITALLFLTQKAHVQYVVDDVEESADTNLIDYTRARIVRDALLREDVNWEDLHV